MPNGRCLSEDEILALSEGAMSAELLAAAQDHLDFCPACRRLLVAASQTASATERTPESAREDTGAELVELPVGRGTPIGRYLVTGVLGAGAMGAVYAAYDP